MQNRVCVLTVFVLLCFGISEAGLRVYIFPGGSTTASSVLLSSNDFEDNDTDFELDVGGSVSGTTYGSAAVNSTSPIAGTYDLDTVDATSCVYYSNTSDNLIKGSEGTFIWTATPQAVPGQHDNYWRYDVDADNYIFCKNYNADIACTYRAGAISENVDSNADYITNGTERTWKFTWDSSNIYIYLWVTDAWVQQDTDTVAGTWAGTSGTLILGAGSTTGSDGMDQQLDEIEIYATVE